MESIFEQTINGMNSGLRLEDIIESVHISDEYLKKPYLLPQYDQINFIVRNIWRLHGGWWDGNPANLEPVHSRILAAEFIRLSGGVHVIQARIKELLIEKHSKENLALAAHLVCIFVIIINFI